MGCDGIWEIPSNEDIKRIVDTNKANLSKAAEAILEKGLAPTTTLRTPSRQLPQVGLKKEQPCQMLLLSAFPADALSRVTEN